MKRGAISITTVILIATPIVAVVAGYYANALATNDKISQAKSLTDKDLSDVRERVTAVETNVNISLPAIDKRLDSIDGKLDKLLNK